MRHVNLRVGVRGSNSFNAFGRGNERKKFNLFISSFLYKVDCRLCRAAGCERGVYDNAGAVYAVFGQFTIILVRLEGFLVAIQTYMPYFSRGEKRGKSVYHTESRP